MTHTEKIRRNYGDFSANTVEKYSEINGGPVKRSDLIYHIIGQPWIPFRRHNQAAVHEAYFLSMLKHCNIVGYGDLTSWRQRMVLVTEYCSLGDLQDLINIQAEALRCV
eukprot:1189124-Prorocentrum_minimum.AAC.3